MKQVPKFSNLSTSKRFSSQDIVITGIVVLGLVGSAIIWILKVPPIIVSFFLATGVASLVYRFLGGIKETTFTIGTLKWGTFRFTGSIGALIGCALLVNGILEQQTRFQLSTDLTPNVNTWFAIEKNKGIPLEVKIKGTEESIKEPPLDIFANIQLNINPVGDKLRVVSEVNPDFILGNLSVEDLQKIGLFNTIEKKLVNFIVTKRLSPSTADVDLDPIPFKLSTRHYGGEYSRYTLADKAGNTLHEGAINRRQTEIVKLQDKCYLVAVVEVNHNPKEAQGMYAKFAVGEIVTKIQP